MSGSPEWHEGYEACKNNRRRTENPYIKDTEYAKYTAWDFGWYTAFLERIIS